MPSPSRNQQLSQKRFLHHLKCPDSSGEGMAGLQLIALDYCSLGHLSWRLILLPGITALIELPSCGTSNHVFSETRRFGWARDAGKASGAVDTCRGAEYQSVRSRNCHRLAEGSPRSPTIIDDEATDTLPLDF
jgi:hypothetical protein